MPEKPSQVKPSLVTFADHEDAREGEPHVGQAVRALLLGGRVPVLDCLSLARERRARGLLLLTGRGVDPEVEQERLERLSEACAGSALELGLFELSARLVPHRMLAVERCLELRTLADWVSGHRATPSRSSSELVAVGAC